MADETDDVGELVLRLYAELREMNIRVGALRVLIQEQLGVSDAQYADALAKVTAASRLFDPGGPPQGH